MKKCRCYINAKYYARQANKGGNMKGYKPCPIHEKEEEKQCPSCGRWISIEATGCVCQLKDSEEGK